MAAELGITEFEKMTSDVSGKVVPIAEEPSLKTHFVAIGTETQSDVFLDGTKMVKLKANAICHIKFGTDPTANTTTSEKMLAGDEIWRGVPAGYRISVIVGA